MEVINDDSHVYYYSYRDIPEDLKSYGFKAVKNFGVKEKFFHFKFFRKKDDQQLIALEANIRPPGGYTIDMFNFANEIDLYFEWANIIVNNEFSSTYSRNNLVCYVGRKHSINFKHSREDILIKFTGLIVLHTDMPLLFRKAMGDYCFIFKFKKIDELSPIIEYVLSGE